MKSGYITLAFSRAHKWAELLHDTCILEVPVKGEKISGGCINPALSPAKKWAELLHNPCILGGPLKRGPK